MPPNWAIISTFEQFRLYLSFCLFYKSNKPPRTVFQKPSSGASFYISLFVFNIDSNYLISSPFDVRSNFSTILSEFSTSCPNPYNVKHDNQEPRDPNTIISTPYKAFLAAITPPQITEAAIPRTEITTANAFILPPILLNILKLSSLLACAYSFQNSQCIKSNFYTHIFIKAIFCAVFKKFSSVIYDYIRRFLLCKVF